MSDPEVPTDDVLLRLADRAAGLIANGPALCGHAPDLAGESEVRHQLHALLLELERKARRLCEVRGT